jgi:predicted nucleic acid-binding protein
VSGWPLDTDVFSELRKQSPSARVRSFIAGLRLEELFVSTVTLAEIRYGIETVSDPRRRAAPN